MLKRILSILLCLLILTGCAAAEPQVTVAETEETTLPVQTEPTPYEEMLTRSLLSLGNPARLQAAIAKARAGENITIAYIGGSITEGPDVKPAERYVALSYHEFEDAYCNGGKVTAINAGLSGTPSNLGVLRLQRDVLDHKPDIVFVEFAVNDAQDMHQKQCFESLLRTVLTQENEPAVVLIFNRTKDGYTCQNTMGLTGRYYDLPMISVSNAITGEMEAGRMTWRDYSDDMVHPNPHGHRLTADFIANLFRKADEAEPHTYSVPEKPHIKAPFVGAVMVTPESENPGAVSIKDLGGFEVFRGNRKGFPLQWRAKGTQPLCFTVTGNAVFLIYHRNKTSNMGSADVYVNGEKIMTIHSQDSSGWGDPWSQLIVRSKTVETFDVEIHPVDDKLFEIYAIAYTQNTRE